MLSDPLAVLVLLNVSSSCIVNVYVAAVAPVPDLLKTPVVSLIEK